MAIPGARGRPKWPPRIRLGWAVGGSPLGVGKFCTACVMLPTTTAEPQRFAAVLWDGGLLLALRVASDDPLPTQHA